MGGGVSLDGEIAEAKQITVDFAAAFVKNYSKLYTIGLVKDAKKRLKKKAAGPQWKLMKVDKEPPPPIRHQGQLLKLSKHLKKWNPRYTIIRGDWIVEYWETEEKFKSGQKCRGTINLSGLTVVRDVNNTLINRIMALAEKCNLPVDQLPKPEQYPDFTIQLYHDRRAPIYLQAANAEDFKKWCDMLDNCRWYAPSLDITDDKIHKAVFSWALWRTRWQVDMWGWWSSGGGEVAMIADCINEQIGWKVMGKVDSKLTMPWAVRSRIRDTFMKTTSGFVTSAVSPAWSACYEAVKKVRPTISSKIDEMMEPVVEATSKVEAKIIEKVEQVSKQTLEEKVTPNLAPLLDVVFGPVIDAMKIVVQAFDEAVVKMRADEKYATNKDEKNRMYFCSRYSYNPLFWEADNKLWGLYDILWDMRRIFDDVSPWGILYKCRRRVRKLMQNALFTFETLLEQEGSDGFDATLARVRELLLEDCKAAVMRILGQILFGVVEPMWEKVVIRPSRKLVEPLVELIPEPLRELLDVEDMLEGILYNILKACCATVFAPYASRVSI